MVLNKFTGSILMDGNEDDLFKVFGTTLKHFASYVYLKALQAGDSIRIRAYDKVDDVSRYKLDGDVNDSVGTNNGTITNIASWVSQWKFDSNVLDSIGSNNGTITYNSALTALYKFDGTINDSTSGAHNLTLAAGTTTYVTGQEGQAIKFDGSTYYTATSSAIVTGAADRSVSFWIKTPSTFVGNAYYIFSWGADSTNNLFGATWNDTGSTSRILFAGFANDIVTTTFLASSTWYYLTFVLSSSGTVRTVYVDGVQDKQSTTTALNTSSSSLYIGASVGGGAIIESGVLMDEFRIYSIALTAAQVSALYMSGKFGQSHTFDGGENVSIATTSGMPTGNSAFSVSLWVKPSTVSVQQLLFNLGTQSIGDAMIIAIDESGSGIISIDNYGGVILNSAGTISAGIWSHIVVTSDGTTTKIYINGVQDANTLAHTWNIVAAGLRFSGYSGGANLTGQLDEVRVYNVALTASQVLGLYNYTGSNYISPLPQGNAILFNGSTYIQIPNQTPYSFEYTNAFSVSGWFKSTSVNQQVLISKKSSSNALTAGWDVWQYTDGTVRFEIASTSTQLQIQTGSAYNDGNWHNVICTYSGNSNRSGMNLYIDGVLITTGTSLAISTTVVNTQNAVIGADGSGNAKYSGLLDEMQVFNYVLSAGEISNIYAGRFGNTHPIGLWHFDGDLYDYSGQGSTGIPTGTIEYVTGALSGSYGIPNEHFNFDGSEYISLGNPTNLQFEYTQPFTIEFWCKTIIPTGTLLPVIFNGTNFDQEGIKICIQFGLVIVRLTNTSSSSEISVDSGFTTNDGLWHQYMITYSGNGKASGVKIYQDGVLGTNTVNTDNLSASILSGNNWNIGSFSGGVSPTNYEIDDVRIYNRALSAGEVLDLFNYPDSPMKELVYDRTYSGVKSDAIYVPMLQGNQYKVTCQQITGTNRIIPFERWEVT